VDRDAAYPARSRHKVVFAWTRTARRLFPHSANATVSTEAVFAAPIITGVVQVCIRGHDQFDAYIVCALEAALTTPLCAIRPQIRIRWYLHQRTPVGNANVPSLALPVITSGNEIPVLGNSDDAARLFLGTIASIALPAPPECSIEPVRVGRHDNRDTSLVGLTIAALAFPAVRVRGIVCVRMCRGGDSSALIAILQKAALTLPIRPTGIQVRMSRNLHGLTQIAGAHESALTRERFR